METCSDATEAVVDVPSYFGFDFDPATEGVKEMGVKISGALKSAGEKLHAAIRKFVEWIKSKFISLLKIDSITIDAKYWDNAMKVVSELEKADTTPISQKVKQALANLKNGKGGKDEAQAAAEEALSKKIDAIKESTEFGAIKEYSHAEGSQMISVRTGKLSSMKNKLAKDLQALQEVANGYDAGVSASDEASYTDMYMGDITKGTSAAIRTIQLTIEVINGIITHGNRSNEKAPKEDKK